MEYDPPLQRVYRTSCLSLNSTRQRLPPQNSFCLLYSLTSLSSSLLCKADVDSGLFSLSLSSEELSRVSTDDACLRVCSARSRSSFVTPWKPKNSSTHVHTSGCGFPETRTLHTNLRGSSRFPGSSSFGFPLRFSFFIAFRRLV